MQESQQRLGENKVVKQLHNFLHGDPKNSFQQESQFSIHNLVTDTNRERSVHQDSPSKNRNRYRQQQSSSQRQNKSK